MKHLDREKYTINCVTEIAMDYPAMLYFLWIKSKVSVITFHIQLKIFQK